MHFPIENIEISFSNFKCRLDELVHIDQFTHLNDEKLHFHVPEVANYLVENGQKITIQRLSDLYDDYLKVYLNGTVLGAILYQSNQTPLHASTIHINDKTILIAGDSGVGKSSTSFSMILKGAQFINDDISPLVFNKNWETYSVSSSVKIQKDKLIANGLYKETLDPVPNTLDKIYWKPLDQIKENVPIDAMFILNEKDIQSYNYRQINGSEAFEAVLNQLYRKEFMAGFRLNQIQCFNNISDFITKVPVYIIERPKENSNPDEISELIVQIINH